MLAVLRRYRLPGLLFSLCLSLVLVCAHAVPWSRPAVATPMTQTGELSRRGPASLTETVRQTVLENGLTVLTKEVPTTPVVTVQVWYKVGSRNEAPGVNGIAHQLEHLLFKGTQSRPIQFGRLFNALGSESNAFTSYDQTAYFGTVQREKLQALLTLEADRMANALINAEQLTSEKRVVISELQGYENDPAYRLSRAVMRAALPNSPYGLPVGGTKADVNRFTVEQVRQYYQQYYSPDNAVLIVVGDFQTEPTLRSIRQIFGRVPKRERPATSDKTTAAPAPTSRSAAKEPIVLKEPGSSALLQAVYPLPAVNHPDVPALSVLDLVLTQGRSSRLYQSLVESGLASGFGGGPANLAEGGWYELTVTAAPGKTLTEIDQQLQQSIAEVQRRPVTAQELSRAKQQLLAAITLRSRDITAQAMQLGDDQTTAGDYRFTDRFLAAVQQVSAADVQRVAQTYLKPAQRTVGLFEPTQASGSGSNAPVKMGQTTENFNLGPPVDPAEVARYLPPSPPSATRTNQPLPERLVLSNGLRVLLLRDSSTPTVTLSGHIEAGTEFDLDQKAGLASLTAENLMNGTQAKDALTLATTLEDRGASLSFGANREGVGIGGYSLSTDLPVLLQTLTEVLQTATFPTDQLELSRQQALTGLQESLDDPGYLARRVIQQAIYPSNHPFHPFPTEASLKSISRDDLVRFYQSHYRPDRTILTLLGDFDPTQVKSLLEQNLASWKGSGAAPSLAFPSVPLPPNVLRLNRELPGKAQAVTYIGYNAINRRDPRYYAALLLNHIVGGDTLSSRLGTEIRDRLGLTYGIFSFFQAGNRSGPFLVEMQTAPEDTQRAVNSTLALLTQIRNQGVTTPEVLTAQRSITSGYPVGLANPDSLADTILMNEVYGLNPNELRQFPEQIEAVTPAQVNQVAKELLHPNRLVVVTAGPAAATSSTR